MAQLVCLLSTGKGTWAEVSSLIKREEFDEVFVITNTFGKEKFTSYPDKKIHLFVFDFEKDIVSLEKEIFQKLKPLIKFGDVALNMSSGTGKEHMAVLSAILKTGTGVRLVTLNANELTEL